MFCNVEYRVRRRGWERGMGQHGSEDWIALRLTPAFLCFLRLVREIILIGRFKFL